MTEQDTLYIETEKTEFETLYRLCFNQHDEKKVIFELKAVDDSNIDFVQSYTINGVRKFDCFAVYDNVADGNRFLFFDYENQAAYITPTCFPVSIRYAVLWTFQKRKFYYKMSTPI